MGSTATIDAMPASDPPTIELEDGVFVHGFLITRDTRGAWWGYSDGTVKYSPDCDGLLVQIAHAVGSTPDLDDLRGRLTRSLDRAECRRIEDEAVRYGK